MKDATLEFLHRRHAQARNRMFAAGFALLLSSVLLIIILTALMANTYIDSAKVQARMVAANSDAAILFVDSAAGKQILESLRASPDVESAALYLPKGELLSVYQRIVDSQIISPDARQKINGYKWSLHSLDVIELVKSGDRPVGAVAVRHSLTGFYHQWLLHVAAILAVSIGALLIVRLFLFRMSVAVSTAESHLDYLAHTDSVTMLPNRHAFLKELDLALYDVGERGGQVGVLMIDLDDFKLINDTSGHQGGDEILRLVTQRIKDALGRHDFLCRIGGDEFVVIVRGVGKAKVDIDGLAARILQQLEYPFRYLEQEFFMTASAGGSVYPVDAGNVHELMRMADTAMYAAKNRGKNAFAAFTYEMDKKAQRRMLLERMLRKAIRRDEMQIEYQPQVDGNTGRIVGVEALTRWVSPEIGEVKPEEFIPVAEESGLIIEIGNWALQKACTQMAAWHKAGHGSLSLSVNVSARQFKAKALLQDIREVLVQTGMDPSMLMLEITEGSMMENIEANVDLLLAAQKMGISVSIDDFGTGYSSLAYLKRFAIHQLKIDKSFVRDVPGGSEGLVNAIVAMSHNLGLTVVAEGVETRAQFQFLLDNSCHIFQGFYLARPQPPEALEKLLGKGNVIFSDADARP